MSKKHKAKKSAKARRPVASKKTPAKKNKFSLWLEKTWKKFAANRGLSVIITALAVVLVAAIVVAIVIKVDKNRHKGPGVEISEDFYHETPEGLEENAVVELKNSNAKDYLCKEGGYSENAEPKPYEKGWYIFDRFGVARRYRDEKGEIHDLPLDEQVEHVDVLMGDGIPLQVFGNVKTHVLVYKNKEATEAEACYMYFVLDDETDMFCLLDALQACGFLEVQQVSDTVAEIVMDNEGIAVLLNDYSMENTLDNFLKYLREVYGVNA